MSNHNYSQYSNNKKKKNKQPRVDAVETIGQLTLVEEETAPEVEFVTTVSAPAEPAEIKMDTKQIEDTPKVEHPKPVTIMTGVVSNCTKLNVRSKPAIDADIMAVINANAEVKVDMAKSINDWYKVTTSASIEGYCMRKFISIKR